MSEEALARLVGYGLIGLFVYGGALLRRRRAEAEAPGARRWEGEVAAERVRPFREEIPPQTGLVFVTRDDVTGDELRFRPLGPGPLYGGVVARLADQKPEDLARGEVLGKMEGSVIRLMLPEPARFLLTPEPAPQPAPEPPAKDPG